MAWEPDYVTSTQAKSELRIKDELDDIQIARAITSASRAIDRYALRQFGQLASVEARYYTPWYDEDLRRWVCEIDDIQDLTAVVVAVDTGDDDTYDATLAASEYVFRPRNAASKLRPYTQVSIKNTASQPMQRSDSVKVTGKWGWTSVPTTIEEACLLQISRLIWRRDAPAGVAGSPAQGSEVRLLAKLDPDVEVMVDAYRRLVKA